MPATVSDLMRGPEVRVLSPVKDLVIIQGFGFVGVAEKDSELGEALLGSEGSHGVAYRLHSGR